MNRFMATVLFLSLSANVSYGVCSCDSVSLKRAMSSEEATTSPAVDKKLKQAIPLDLDIDRALYVSPDATVLSSAERNGLFNLADKGILVRPLHFMLPKSGQTIKLYAKGMECLLDDEKKSRDAYFLLVQKDLGSTDQAILHAELEYMVMCKPILLNLMNQRQQLFIEKYYDGLIDLSDLSAGDVKTDFMYWQTLNKAFSNDKVAFFALNLLRFNMVQKNQFKGFFPAIFEGIYQRAQLSDADALFNLGFMCWYGLDGDMDEQKAFSFFKASAIQGNNNAKYLAAMCYRKLKHNPENNTKAYDFLWDAALHGHVPSKLLLLDELPN